MSLTDAQLVARCPAGDEAAWAELVNRFSRYVYAIIGQGLQPPRAGRGGRLPGGLRAAYQHLGRLRDDDAIRPWIAQLTRRLCIDHIRARSREELTDDEIEPAELDETLATLEEALAVHEALADLPEHCQEILDRFFTRDESYQTIGAALDIPAGTIASRISAVSASCVRSSRKKTVRRTVLNVMTPNGSYDEARLADLLRALPAPEGWVRARSFPASGASWTTSSRGRRPTPSSARQLIEDLEAALRLPRATSPRSSRSTSFAANSATDPSSSLDFGPVAVRRAGGERMATVIQNPAHTWRKEVSSTTVFWVAVAVVALIALVAVLFRRRARRAP